MTHTIWLMVDLHKVLNKSNSRKFFYIRPIVWNTIDEMKIDVELAML